jgi:enoyl-CoA hydratase/carnithine racemase
MGRDLFDVFSGLTFDAGSARCAVITGAGRHFCAGGDLKEREGMTDAAWRAQHVVFEQAFYAIMDCPIPVIAAVNGAAYGGGCEMALMCDFIHAADTARFALVETGLGIIPGGGGTQNLPRAVGTRRARELLYCGTPFTAQQALAWGMVNEVFAPDVLLENVLKTAAHIAARAPVAIRQVKRAVGLGATVDIKTGLGIEIEAYNRTVGTADRREGILAAREKRPPRFKGE